MQTHERPFFPDPAKVSRSKNKRANSGSLTAKELEKCACKLVSFGHVGVWDYPYSVFITAIEEAGKGDK